MKIRVALLRALDVIEARRPGVVAEVEAWDREVSAVRARLAAWLSPVTEEERLETSTRLAEESARAAYLEGVLESIQVEAVALRAARLRADQVASAARADLALALARVADLESTRDRVGESMRRTGIS